MLGGSVGYTVGFFLHPVGNWLLHLTGSDPPEFRPLIRQWGVLMLAVPIPYKLTAIASGHVQACRSRCSSARRS